MYIIVQGLIQWATIKADLDITQVIKVQQQVQQHVQQQVQQHNERLSTI